MHLDCVAGRKLSNDIGKPDCQQRPASVEQRPTSAIVDLEAALRGDRKGDQHAESHGFPPMNYVLTVHQAGVKHNRKAKAQSKTPRTNRGVENSLTWP
jgi:hypothetical protein